MIYATAQRCGRLVLPGNAATARGGWGGVLLGLGVRRAGGPGGERGGSEESEPPAGGRSSSPGAAEGRERAGLGSADLAPRMCGARPSPRRGGVANGRAACCAFGQWRGASVPSSVAKGSGEAGAP